MKKQVLFIHGGGDDSYNGDKKMAASLAEALSDTYEVSYPQMNDDENDSEFGWQWPRQIGEKMNEIKGDIILVGHSLGASLILKYFSENKIAKKISGIFLIAPPFWSGDEDWMKGLILQNDFAGKLPGNTPIFLYYSIDDEVVPSNHFSLYVKKIPQAIVREMKEGGHQLNDDLGIVAKDIGELNSSSLLPA